MRSWRGIGGVVRAHGLRPDDRGLNEGERRARVVRLLRGQLLERLLARARRRLCPQGFSPSNVGSISHSSHRGRGARIERCACSRGHDGNRIFVRLGDGELV